MATVTELPAPTWSIERLQNHFGGIAANRIHRYPKPGTAQKRDLILWNKQHDAACELIDGVLVEKVMSTKESVLALLLGTYLNIYLQKNPLGIMVGADGSLEIMPGLVRIPDLSFLSWETIGADELPDVPVGEFTPDLAVEVISKSNTPAEMQRKVADYFASGTKLVWLIYPKRKAVHVYESTTKRRIVTDVLDGGTVLPGFSLNLDELFSAGRRSKR